MEWAPQGKGGLTIHGSERLSMEVNEIQKKNSCDTLWYGLVGMVVFGQREDLIILEIFPTQMIL